MNKVSLPPSLEQDVQQLLARGEVDGALKEMRGSLPAGGLAFLQRWVDLLLQRGLWHQALELLSGGPDFPAPEMELLEGRCRLRGGERERALSLFDSARACPDAQPETRARASFILLMEGGRDKLAAGDAAAALEDYRQASEIRPQLPAPYVGMGTCQRTLGDMEAATAMAREALQRNPDFAGAYYLLSNCGRPDDSAELAEKVDALLGNPRLADEDRIMLLFARGRFLKNGGDAHRAFDCFVSANALRAERHPFDPESFDREIDFLIESFPEEVLAQTYPGAHDRDGLIFIVGMPRSGTTLCEQILAAHPDVFGGGELSSMNRLAAQLTDRYQQDGTEWIEFLEPELRTSLAESYLDSLDPASGACHWHTDKMPYNFLSVGLIAHLFPNARFLLCRRHPYDIALSVMEQHFTDAHPFALSLDRTARFMLGAQRLTRHWHEVLPERFHTFSYEALTSAPEAEIPQLLERLGVPWNESCLAPEKEKRSVRTASSWQVRQAIYTSSANRWQRYSEEQLAPLREVLPAPEECEDFWPGG